MNSKKEFKSNEKIYDFIAVWAGPAGLTAGIYGGRYKLNCLIIGKIPGGYAGTAHQICNFPSYEKISGMELMLKMMKQVKDYGYEIKQESVEEIDKKNDLFEVKTAKNKYLCKKIILATGTERIKLGLEKEKEFLGKGVSYCVTCDAGFYKDKTVGIVGGGNDAIVDASLISKYAKKVYLIYRGEKFTKVEHVWLEDLEKNKNIEILFNTTVKKLIGDKKLEKIEIDVYGKRRILDVDGVFIQAGSEPNTKLAEKLGLKLEKGEIVVDKKQKTNVDGIFAAGDATIVPFKQIITACSGGAIAVHTIYKELIGEK